MHEPSVESTLLTWGRVGNQFMGKLDDSDASVLLKTGAFKVPTAPWKSSKSHRLWQFNPNRLSGRILLRVVLQRRKMNPRALTRQSEVIKCLLHTLLAILLLLNPWVSAGFISPGNSVSVGRSPTLRYLIACGHLATRPPIVSTHDIYTNEQVLHRSCICICLCIKYLPPKLKSSP